MLRATARKLREIGHCTIIGGGQMGAQIAMASASHDVSVTMVDVDDSVLKRSVNQIKQTTQRVVKKKFKNDKIAAEEFTHNVMSRVSTDVSLASAVSETDLVIEAITENLSAKQNLFGLMEDLFMCPEETIYVSNTSSLSIEKIAKLCAEDRKPNIGGLHFFNPVAVMPLIEVIRVDGMTSDETFDTLCKFGQRLGKTIVKCEDTPGFIVDRLMQPYIFEAIRLHERGHGSIKDIDLAMKLGAGHPMGPFELADYIGLDTCKFIMGSWERDNPNDQIFESSSLLDKYVDNEDLGRKANKGFYSYKGGKKIAVDFEEDERKAQMQ